jgi:hypothetical protein
LQAVDVFKLYALDTLLNLKPQDIEGYMDGKDEFVKLMEKKVLERKAMTQTHQDLLLASFAPNDEQRHHFLR